jgi:hypothetical protein
MQSTAQLSTGQAMMLRMVVGFIEYNLLFSMSRVWLHEAVVSEPDADKTWVRVQAL